MNISRTNRPLLGLFDNDSTGRAEFERLKNIKILPDTIFRQIGHKGGVFAGTLDMPNHLNDVSQTFQNMGLSLPLPIEYMFHAEILNLAIEQNVLELRSRTTRFADNELPFQINASEHLGQYVPADMQYLVQKLTDASKISFADWVCDRESEDFDVFTVLFESLAEVLEHNT